MPSLPLLGLLDDVVFPGEERALARTSFDPALLARFDRDPPQEVCIVAISSAVELPSLVVNRFATRAHLVATVPTVTLRGIDRVRIAAATGSAPDFTAEFTVAGDPTGRAFDTALVAGARSVLAALDAGVIAEAPGAPEAVRDSLARLVRALTPERGLRDALTADTPAALDRLAQSLARGTGAERASDELEKSLAALLAKPEPSRAQRQRLWSQVVEIQKQLDVFDPAVPAEDGDEIARLQRRLSQAGLPRAAREIAKRELRLLRGMKADHHDYSSYVRHLDLVARLAWVPEPVPDADIRSVAAALDREHHGLDAPKKRILEYLAVRTLGGDASATVLCLAGPPGVGKTSIARVIAESLGRKFVRVSLGGVHDESEIRGHRISFTAARAGRIIDSLARVGSNTAVVLLDEIDKLGTDRSRSPYAALLEVLDPEQNSTFEDNYLAMPYDLSNVLFVCTANDLSAIDPILRDRLEVIELDGYLLAEKLTIARAHLLPRLATRSGLPRPPDMDDEVLATVAERYTREAGVRQFERALASLHRARALAVAKGETDVASRAVTPEEIRSVLGSPRFEREKLGERLAPGAVHGLSVSADGGAPLRIEVGLMKGRGKLHLTGNLGDVMRESAQTVLAHLRMSHAAYGLEANALDRDVYVHVPEAAVPKDGPSAGIALAVAIVSAATQRAVRSDVTLTGEVTLHGEVRRVGGVRAKVLAAERAGAQTVVLPADNMVDAPDGVKVQLRPVRTVREALQIAFGDVDGRD